MVPGVGPAYGLLDSRVATAAGAWLPDAAQAPQRPAGVPACDLWEPATQPVAGAGTRGARLMLIGEQPGDREDIEGQPFVGPAGAVLDRGLERAGIARQDAFVTNVVKHFRYKAQGKRLIQPEVVVCLGATAGQALLGSQIRIGRDRGRPIESDLAEFVTVTAHPSSILRARGAEEREQAMDEFVSDLIIVASWLGL